MSDTVIKYFIVSLPRTGTKSLCRMTALLGFEFKHVPSVALSRLLRENTVEVFADTPIFAPSTFTPLLEHDNHKFIYINKPASDWVESFERVGLNSSYMALYTNKIPLNCVNMLDSACLREVFQNLPYDTTTAIENFNTHRNQVYNIIPSHRLLTYEFSMGWGPLCEFMGVNELTVGVPHINADTMYDII